ncbi:MAG TPA: 2Fe-2S iron-sulfur cluster binding domain-containing protein [Methylibium sp.]|nr:2Fe-2S iron-sulfur cluster binding domain-containing protein [Methylibium sp.]
MFGLFASKGPFKVRLSGADQEFTVPPGDTVLKAAIANGLKWPNSCRVGSCGTCRCRLKSGKIKALNDFSYVLTESELDDGFILACQTALRGNVEIDVALDGADGSRSEVKTVDGTIAGIRELTHDIREVRVHVPGGFSKYKSGQFAELSVASLKLERPRSYSFASAPERESDGLLTFHVRHVPKGQMTTWIHSGATIGDPVAVTGPHGHFYLRDTPAPIVCIAGGSGMAPIKALLEGLADSGFKRDAVYLYGARTQRDLYCLEEMKLIEDASGGRFRFIPILSSEPDESNWPGYRGFVTDFIAREKTANVNSEAYLCGPPPMIDAAIAQLKLLGVNDRNIFFDKFLDASHLQAASKAAA